MQELITGKRIFQVRHDYYWKKRNDIKRALVLHNLNTYNDVV